MEFPRGRQTQFGGRERVEPQQVITALQRIAAETIEIKAPASGDQNLLPSRSLVEQSFEVVPPLAIFVELVEDPELRHRQLPAEDPLAVLRGVPAEIPRPAARELTA